MYFLPLPPVNAIVMVLIVTPAMFSSGLCEKLKLKNLRKKGPKKNFSRVGKLLLYSSMSVYRRSLFLAGLNFVKMSNLLALRFRYLTEYYPPFARKYLLTGSMLTVTLVKAWNTLTSISVW